MSDTVEIAGDSLEDLFGTSERDTEEGKWFKLGEHFEVKLRRFNSKKSQKVRAALDAPYKSIYKFQKMPDDLLDKITTEHIASGIIIDWRGVKEDGKLVPYSKAKALAALEKYPDLRAVIADLSISLDNYREETKDETEGN